MRTGLATLGLVLLLVSGPALADGYDETEHRLKTAGIDEGLREQIHAAIRRGVCYVRTLQRKDGSFHGTPGYTALAGLALRHAAIPDAIEGGRAAIEALHRTSRGRPLDNTYAAGLLAMLLTADRSHGDWNRAHHDALAKGPKKDSGYWGYAPAGGSPPPNLSTAQFACLGLWAGERAGADVAKKAWRLHLDALLRAQQPDGSWGYSPGPATTNQLGMGYPTGTYMGLADLALAAQALRGELREDPHLWSRVLLATAVGRGTLRRHVAWELDSFNLPVLFGNIFPFYRLYALEKVCVFLDLEDVAGRRWYEEGARRLIRGQRRDGGWTYAGSPQWGLSSPAHGTPIDTSFALLFLLRASHAYHPITPRPVDRAPVITPGDDPDEPTPAPGPPITALPRANALLDELEAWLAQRKLDTPGRALDAFADVRRIHGEYRPAGVPRSEAHDTWCRRAENALLQATTRFLRAPPRYRTRWQAVAIHALDTLAATDRRIAPALMRTIETMPTMASFPDPVRVGWYSAAFDALRRLRAPALAAWIVDRMLSTDTKLWPRTSAALVTLGGIRGLRGVQRRSAVKGVLERLAPLLKRHAGTAPTRDLQLDALIAIRRLASQGDSELPPLESGDARQLIRAVRSWWLSHSSASDRAWKD